MPEVTQLLNDIIAGKPQAAEELLPLVYDELRRLARAQLSREPAGHTLQPTALVHEAYLRLSKSGEDKQWDRRGHFFAAAAIAMRRILVERARHYQRIKHGGQEKRVAFDIEQVDRPGAGEGTWTDVLVINDALDRLVKMDARKAQVVMLRYFAGLSVEETASALGLSPTTVKTEWAFARAWFYRTLRGDAPEAGEAP